MLINEHTCLMNKTNPLLRWWNAGLSKLKAIDGVRSLSVTWRGVPPRKTKPQGPVLRSILPKISLKKIIQVKDHGITMNLRQSNEHEIDAGGMWTVNEHSLPIGLAMHCYQFKSFNHLPKQWLILLRGCRTFGIPIAYARGGLLKRAIEVTGKNQEMVWWDIFDTILNLFLNLSSTSAKGLSTPAGIPGMLIDGNQIVWMLCMKANLDAASRNVYGRGKPVGCEKSLTNHDHDRGLFVSTVAWSPLPRKTPACLLDYEAIIRTSGPPVMKLVILEDPGEVPIHNLQ